MSIISHSEKNTLKIAEELAPLFMKGDVILLEGGLATGKTYFVKGFSNYFKNKEVVTSPTFSIANFYSCESVTLLHMDLYRISTIEEFEDLGIEEYFSDAIVLIEWGEKLFQYLDEYFLVSFECDENNREYRSLSFSFKGERVKSKMDLLYNKLSKFRVC
ncbi:MAG: tRNA (adenosine(37)-N6)-threonylcarbamoyltransferase complex ATPase subunit type 1 TsaE [Mariniphaga sp.]